MILAAIAIAALPLVEKPVRHATNQPYFAVFLTGDGGWRHIDDVITADLNARGIPVVGLLSNHYFSVKRMPADVARDVDALIERYAARWHKAKVIVIGYSRGADAIPAIIANSPLASRARIAVAAMLGPALRMELQMTHWWELGRDPPSVPLLPMVRAVRGVPMLCVHGTQERESLCNSLTRAEAVNMPLKGGHHFGGGYHEIANAIVAAARK